MELFLLRHARAEEPHHYAHDAERPLSHQGHYEHQRIAQVLAPLLQPLDYILSSPLIRARQTAEITATAIQFPHSITATPMLGEDCTVNNVIALLREYPPQSRLLCVGHEPFMNLLAAAFLASSRPKVVDFQRSAIVGLYFPEHPAAGMGTLRLCLHPTTVLALCQFLPGAGSA